MFVRWLTPLPLFLVSETSSRNAVELPPELCIVVMSPLSAHTLYTFSFIPSIMYRIQCMLLSVKLKSQLGPRMQQFDIPALKVFILLQLCFMYSNSFNSLTAKLACYTLHTRTKLLVFNINCFSSLQWKLFWPLLQMSSISSFHYISFFEMTCYYILFPWD